MDQVLPALYVRRAQASQVPGACGIQARPECFLLGSQCQVHLLSP